MESGQIDAVVCPEDDSFCQKQLLLHFVALPMRKGDRAPGVDDAVPWKLGVLPVAVEGPDNEAGAARKARQTRNLSIGGDLPPGDAKNDVYDGVSYHGRPRRQTDSARAASASSTSGKSAEIALPISSADGPDTSGQ